MLPLIRTYIRKHQMLIPDRPVVVGLSGGADSVALLSILVRLGYDCLALHCNFHLRGEESMRDERFAETFARTTLGIPFYKTDFDTEKYASQKHISVEMAARELRYRWFEEMREQLGAQAIAVAHHRDDQAETVLMHLVRGSGIRGLRGMVPKNGYIIRPLLTIGRKEILSWLESEGYTYMTDSTNQSDAYTRNFIRLRILPLLEEINPSAGEAIARSAEHLAEAEALYLNVLAEAKTEIIQSENRFSIPALLKYPSPSTVLYELLKPYGFTRSVAEDLFSSLHKTSGKEFFSPAYRLIKDRDNLLLAPRTVSPVAELYVLEGEKGDLKHPIELSWHKSVITEDFTIVKDKRIAYFDYEKLGYPLTLRKWQEGDWFIPFGMKGRKKLSDYFTNQKYSRIDKEAAWLLCCGPDIIWIVGERPDNRFCINKATKSVLMVNFSH